MEIKEIIEYRKMYSDCYSKFIDGLQAKNRIRQILSGKVVLSDIKTLYKNTENYDELEKEFSYLEKEILKIVNDYCIDELDKMTANYLNNILLLLSYNNQIISGFSLVKTDKKQDCATDLDFPTIIRKRKTILSEIEKFENSFLKGFNI